MDFLKKKKEGFTIVELVLVILVMGILMAVIVSRFGFMSDKANETGMKTDFRAFQTAAESAVAEYSFKAMNVSNVGDKLNSYLDESLVFKDGYSVKENPWGFQYMLNIEKTSGDGSSGRLVFLSPKSTDEGGNQKGFKLIVTVADGAISSEILEMAVGDSVLDPEDGSVTGIYVFRSPTKTSYYEGESFDKQGMIIKTRHADGSSSETADYTVSGGSNMSIGTNVITITYTPDPSLSANVTVTVTRKQDSGGDGGGGGGGGDVVQKTLSNIQVTSQPSKTAYKAGEYFSASGMVVTANFSDGSSSVVTGSCQWNNSALTKGQTQISISYVYGGVTKSTVVYITVAEGTVNPEDKTLQSIHVSRQPAKTSYLAGESFLTAGMELTLTFSDGSSQVVASGFTHDGYNLQSGATQVNVNYIFNNVTKTTQVTIAVTKVLTGISITKQPTKLEYVEGEAFQTSGMMVTAFYSDGSSNVVTNYTLPINLITVKGMNRFTITYSEGAVTKTTDVVVYAVAGSGETDKQVTGVSVDGTSTPKTQYFVGENFDSTGLYLSVQYNDGTKKRTSSFNVENGFNLQLGTQVLTLKYADEYGTGSTTITVTVKEKPTANLTRLVVTQEPLKTTYFVGEDFDPAGMVLTAYYDDPTLSGVVVPLNQVTYIGDKDLTKTSQVVLIKYKTPQGAELSTSIQIKMNGSLVSVELESASDKTDYAVGESYDLTGVKLKVTFDDGETASVTPTTFAPSAFTATGDVEVLLSYEHNKIIKSVPVTVKVRGVLTSIAITKEPLKKEYREGFSFDTNGMEVTAHYGSGASETTEVVSNYQVIDGEKLALGTNRVVIKYTYGSKTVSTSQPIIVYSKLAKPIAAGSDTSFFIDENEKVFACGRNTEGQLGVGDKVNSGLFREVPLEGIRQVIPSRYSNQTFFLKSDGKVFATGTNSDGRLGIGNTDETISPVQVDMPEGSVVTKVCSGSAYTLFLTSEGKVYVSGASTSGAGGTSTVGQKNSPDEIIAFTGMQEKVVDIECTEDNSFYIMSNGDIYACGTNDLGELGTGDKVAVTYPIKIDGIPAIKEVITSNSHTLFISSNNQVYSSGKNNAGQLGLGHTKETLVPTKSIMLSLAYNYSDTEKSELLVNGENTMIFKPDKTLYGIGNTDNNGAGYNSHFGSSGPLKTDSKDYNQLYLGRDHCLIMKDDLKLYTHSSAGNSYGELGRGLNSIGYMSDIQMAYDFDEIDHYILLDRVSYINTKSGNAYTVGADIYQKAKLGRTTGAVLEIAEISSTSDRTKILNAIRGIIPDHTKNGNDYVCYKDGSTDVIGRSYYFNGGAYNGNSADYIYPTLTKAGAASDIVRVVTGSYGSFAYSSTGSVYSCGVSKCLGDTTSPNHNQNNWSISNSFATQDFTALGTNLLSFSAYSGFGNYYYNAGIGVSKDGTISCWGNPTNYMVPPSFTGNSVYHKNKLITNVSNVKDVAVSMYSSVILKEDGTVWHTGQVYLPGTSGYSPDSSSYAKLSGVEGIDEFVDMSRQDSRVVMLAGLSDGKLVNVCGTPVPDQLKNLTGIKSVKYSDRVRWFITMDNGDLMAYGNNNSGCLGIGTTDTPTAPTKVLIDEPIVEIYTDGSLTCFVGESGTEYLAGSAANGRIPGETESQPTPFVKKVLKLAS